MVAIKKSTNNSPRLLLESLQILRYRCFESLIVNQLGRVNLIVGKNNVGKTAMLEALSIYANGGSQRLLFKTLEQRNEIPSIENGNYHNTANIRGVRNLFFNRPNLDHIAGAYPTELDNGLSFVIGENIDISGEVPTLVNRMLQVRALRSPAPDTVPQLDLVHTLPHTIDNLFIKAGGLSDEDLVGFWDNIEKWVLEDSVTKALNIIVPDLVDVRFSGYPLGSNTRIPVVRLAKAKERVPLRSLGDGMTRLLGIASAMINCQDGMLLVDEIESGLHYSVLPDIWKLVFRTAKDLNIQVFATTHSKDCIEAFAIAAAESPEDGMLIRLERQGENIVAKTIEEDMLVDAVNFEVEVR